MINNRRLIVLLIAILPLCLTGCIYNVANDPRYPTDYIVGATYRFKQPVYAQNGERSILGFFVTDYMLEPLKPGETAEDYELKARNTRMYPSYDERWSDIAGVVYPGALIRITHIELDKSSFPAPRSKHEDWKNGPTCLRQNSCASVSEKKNERANQKHPGRRRW